MSPQDACEVCGRTFLVGEKIHFFVSAEGRHGACELCLGRAAELGWLPADQEGAEEALRVQGTRKPGFFGRLFGRAEESRDEPVARGEGDPWDEGEDAPPPASHELETERYDVEAEWEGDGGAPVRPSAETGPPAEPVRPSAETEPTGTPAEPAPDLPHGHAAHLPAPDEVPESETSPPPAAPAPEADASPAPLPDPAGRGMRPRRLQPDLSPAGRFERAVSRFNAGDAGRTAAGLTRTLGAPSVSVGDLAGEEDVVRVTVAWELTWYQWGVDLGDELRPVFELARGYEVAEIDAAARQWNASAHDGRIVLIAPPRREAENGRPVHR